jgi:hypothetical protein
MADNIVIVILVFLLVGIFFVSLNKSLKKTNWYRNIFVYPSRIIFDNSSLLGIDRNLDIVNLGSTSARYAFFYEEIRGQNWSTGGQALYEDFMILKKYYSLIKKGGVVLIPISFFTSISKSPKHSLLFYYAKFIEIVDFDDYKDQKDKIYYFKEATLMKKYPLLKCPKSIRYLIRDVYRDDFILPEQAMQYFELIYDADHWAEGWKKTFEIEDLTGPLSEKHQKNFEDISRLLNEILNFCIKNGLRPVIIIPPVSKFLSSRLPMKFREQYIYSFIYKANDQNILVLDYLDDKRFQDSQYYCNSSLLNLKGRKIFTLQVLQDIKDQYDLKG